MEGEFESGETGGSMGLGMELGVGVGVGWVQGSGACLGTRGWGRGRVEGRWWIQLQVLCG